MRRRNSDGTNSDSLDLLLDTICNTFGGIVFISLLVVILANVTGKGKAIEPPDPVSRSKLIALRRELATEQQKLQHVRTAVSQQQQIQGEFTSRASFLLADQLRRERVRVATVVGHNNALLAEVAAVQARTNAVAKQIADRHADIQSTSKRLESATRQLAREVRKRTKSVALPTVTRWDGDIANAMLKEGTLCLLQVPKGGFLGWNDRESKLIGGREIVPILAAGLKINAQSPDTSAISNKLRVFDSQKHLIRVWVTPDSYQEFAAVRETLVKGRFRYEIRPLPQTGQLLLGGARTRTRAQ